MKIKLNTALFLLRLLLILSFLSVAFVELYGTQKVRIALIYDGEMKESYGFPSQVKSEIEDLLYPEFLTEFVSMYGEWTIDSSDRVLQAAYKDSKIDLIVTLGVMSSFQALNHPTSSKMTVIGYDVRLFSENKIEKNIPDTVAYYKGKRALAFEFEVFKNITHAHKVAVIGDASLLSQSNFPNIVNVLERNFKITKQTPIFLPIIDDAKETIAALQNINVEGVIFLPTWRLSQDAFYDLISSINDMHIPSFSIIGEEEVAEGVFMSLNPKSELIRVSRRIALNTQELLLNGSVDNFAMFNQANELIINETVSKEIEIDLSFKTIEEARFIDLAHLPKKDEITLVEASFLAVQDNLDLEAEMFRVESGKQEVQKAFSELLPLLASNLQARWIDTNSADFGFGSTPQRLFKGSVTLLQSVYDDDKYSKYTVQKRLQKAREYNQETIKLDIIFDTVSSYLSILRIQAEKEIAEENLSLSKANLKRAHELVDLGQARLSEVYRWQSEVSTNKESLVSIDASLQNAKVGFNRILNKPLDNPFFLQAVSLSNPTFTLDFGNMKPLINTPKSFDLFKSYLTGRAQELSPEIKDLEEKIQAKNRELLNAKRSLYVPKFTLFGQFEQNIAKGGAGSKPLFGYSNMKPRKTVGMNLSYPLYTGGKRRAEVSQNYFELMQLRAEKESLTDKVQAKVVRAVDKMKSSYEGISFARKSAEAAEKNLTIVTNSYTRGVVSIVDLIDAQNTTIVAKQNHVNAIYSYLLDYMEFQRSVGQFDFLLPDDEQEKVKQDFIQFSDLRSL